MITKFTRPLFIGILVLSAILVFSQLTQTEFVFHRHYIEQGQWWRIVSGNFTHSNYPHLFLNLAGLWVFGFLFIDSIKLKTFIICLLFLSLVVGTCLYIFSTHLIKYYGFSGVLYGLFICGATCSIIKKDALFGALIITTIIGKVIWDAANGGNASSEELIGIPVAVDAHIYGILGGIGISLSLYLIKEPLRRD